LSPVLEKQIRRKILLKKKIRHIIGLVVLLASRNEVQAVEAGATALISSPIGVTVLSDLDFGTIIPASAAAGTVIIDPDTGVRSLTGGVTLVNSTYGPALFAVIGPAGKPYHVQFVNNTITINNPAGATMQVTNFSTNSELNGSKNYKFDAAGNASFKVGGTLTVAANQAKGLYKGTFAVNVNYN
jgi:hypothetical protein